MKLEDFYSETVKSLGLLIEDGFVMTPDVKKNKVLYVDKLPLVIPTKEHTDTLTENNNGIIKPIKTLFNPLRENEINGTSSSIKKMKSIVDIRLSYSISATFELLLKLVNDKDLQKKTSLDLKAFIGTLKEARTQNVKDIVTPATIEKWSKIYSNTLRSTSKGILHNYLKPGGVKDNVKYNRLCSVEFPLYNDLCKLKTKEKLRDVSLSKKEITVFKLIYEYIFPNIEVPGYYSVGSNDEKSPAFISLMKMYANVVTRLNEILESVKFVSEETYLSAKLNCTLTHKMIDAVGKFANELILIPVVSNNEVNKSTSVLLNKTADVNKAINQQPTVRSNTGGNARNILEKINNNNNMQPNQPTYNPTPQPVMEPIDTGGMTTAQKILYGNNPSLMQQHNQNVVKPMGINNMQVQQQQPMYNNVGPHDQTQGYGQPQMYNPYGVNQQQNYQQNYRSNVRPVGIKM